MNIQSQVGRPAPVGGDERLLEPDIVPIAVIGLPDDIQVEPGRPGMLLPQESGVGRTREGGIGDRQVELGVLGTRLLEQALDHVGIVDVLRLRIDGELDGRRDRIVVADGAVAEEHLLHDLVAIERVLDRIAHIGIVEGRLLDVHDIDVVAVARRLGDHEIGVLLQHVERLQIAAIHVVDLAGVERVGARRHIVDRQAFDTVEPALVGFEVVRVLVEGGDDAGLEFLEHIGAGADARLPVDAALFRRHDRE